MLNEQLIFYMTKLSYTFTVFYILVYVLYFNLFYFSVWQICIKVACVLQKASNFTYTHIILFINRQILPVYKILIFY